MSVVTSSREGTIDYKTMARDLLDGRLDFDVYGERYRKPGYTVTSIRRT